MGFCIKPSSLSVDLRHRCWSRWSRCRLEHRPWWRVAARTLWGPEISEPAKHGSFADRDRSRHIPMLMAFDGREEERERERELCQRSLQSPGLPQTHTGLSAVPSILQEELLLRQHLDNSRAGSASATDDVVGTCYCTNLTIVCNTANGWNGSDGLATSSRKRQIQTASRVIHPKKDFLKV